MQTFTIKPCDINETESVQFLCKQFEEKKKFYICTGKEKVGKTALAIKLLNTLSTETLTNYKPVVIFFDDTMYYWQRKLKQDVIIFPFYFKRRVESKDIIATIQKYLLRNATNFIILDGVNACMGKWPKESIITLIGFLIEIVKNNQVNIFVTYRSDTKFLAYPVSSWASQNDLIEAWHLERPEYFGGDIKEFGDASLEIF